MAQVVGHCEVEAVHYKGANLITNRNVVKKLQQFDIPSLFAILGVD